MPRACLLVLKILWFENSDELKTISLDTHQLSTIFNQSKDRSLTSVQNQTHEARFVFSRITHSPIDNEQKTKQKTISTRISTRFNISFSKDNLSKLTLDRVISSRFNPAV